MKETYSLGKDDTTKFAAMVLLHFMVTNGKTYGVILEGSEQTLAPIFRFLLFQEYIEIKRPNYAVTQKGRQIIDDMKKREKEYVDVFDLFCAVDLKTGEYAMASFYNDEFTSDKDPEGTLWKAFLAQERWEDLRIAVAQCKKTNPLDLVFLSYLHGEEFDTTKKDWELDLVLGDTFKRMLAVCNTNLQIDDLGYTYEENGEKKTVTGDDAIRDIVKQGASLMFELLKTGQQKEKEYREAEALYEQQQAENGGVATETVTETVVTEVPDYYDSYYDPYYISPIWAVPVWALILL